MIPQHYTTAEVADLLHCDPETILRLAQRGEIASTRVGSDRRYSETAILEYLDAHAEGTGAQVASLAEKRNARRPRARRTA